MESTSTPSMLEQMYLRSPHIHLCSLKYVLHSSNQKPVLDQDFPDNLNNLYDSDPVKDYCI